MRCGCLSIFKIPSGARLTKNREQKRHSIPHSRPTLGEEEIAAVSDVIASGHVAGGPAVKEFEARFAEYLGADEAVSTASGTAALHLTLLAMGVGPGDEVIIPSYVCCALLNAVHYTGATPVLAEIETVSGNLAVEDVKKRLTPYTRVLIVPHLFGLPADMDALLALNVPIIEDCAQCLGASYNRQATGTLGVAAIFSFYATKVICTGEGGMVVTQQKDIADRVRDLRTYDKKKGYKTRFNSKMTDIQAAMGLVQLERLPWFLRRRREIAGHYDAAFQSMDLQLPPPDSSHIYYRYVLGVKTDVRRWIQKLGDLGIGCDRPIYRPLHQQLQWPGYPATEKAWQQRLSIPIYPSLDEEEIDRVIEAVRSVHPS